MRLGVIADDFTGATNIAYFLVENGMSMVQVSGRPQADDQVQADAIVISLKSRSGFRREGRGRLFSGFGMVTKPKPHTILF